MYLIIQKSNGVQRIINEDGTETVKEVSQNQIKEWEQSAKIERIAQIKAELNLIDSRSIRPIRDGDTEYLETLNAQVVELRQELRTLEK
jgi:hypothetical protein